MFGYRLVRDGDWDAREVAIAKKDAEIIRLYNVLGAAKAESAARASANDYLTTRVNVLEQENAQFRARTTGLPAIAPSIGKGDPLASSAIGAGVDLFSDVGDEMAADLRSKGLLAGDAPDFEMPRASDLTAGLAGGGES